MIEKFRRKPIEVETILWDGRFMRAIEIRDWVGAIRDDPQQWACQIAAGQPANLWVEHSQAWVRVPVGHRIVRESDGNGFYPISPEAVAATWEPAGSSPKATQP